MCLDFLKRTLIIRGSTNAKYRYFYGRGAWDESKMRFMDRTLCKMLQKSVAKKNPDKYEPWMKALMCAVGQSCDWTDEKYLLPLIDYLEK